MNLNFSLYRSETIAMHGPVQGTANVRLWQQESEESR